MHRVIRDKVRKVFLLVAIFAAMLMLFAGALCGMDARNGWRIFLSSRRRRTSS